MKWFKHMSDASRGRSMNYLFDEMGHKGYACYFLLLEMIAEKYDPLYAKENGEKFYFHAREVRLKLRLSGANVARFLHLCDTFALLNCKMVSQEWHIEIPELRSILDNHTKNLQVTTKSLPSPFQADKEKEKEVDKEKDKNKKKKASSEFSEIELEIIKHWNNQNIIEHSESAQFLKAIPGLIKNTGYPLESIKQAIINYKTILDSPNPYYKHKWRLDEFLSNKKALKYYPENFIPENFNINGSVAKTYADKVQDKVLTMDNPFNNLATESFEAEFEKKVGV